MSRVQVVAAMCPGCGAGLGIQPGQDVARCRYCDAESSVVRPGAVSEGSAGLRIFVEPPRADSRAAIAKLNIAVAAVVSVVAVAAGVALRVTTGTIVPLLILIGVAALLAASLGWARGTSILAEIREQERFRERAEPMRAVLEEVRDVGRGNLLDLGLAVTRPDGTSYRVSKRSRVPMVLVGRLRSGMAVPLFVDPEDAARIEIPWHLVSAER